MSRRDKRRERRIQREVEAGLVQIESYLRYRANNPVPMMEG